MKTLINNIKTYLESAITSGNITKAISVQKGLNADPSQIPLAKFGYIAIDDGGERVEELTAITSQLRVYTVIIEMAVYSMDRETAIDNIFDLVNEVKTQVESLANRQYDSHRWGISIDPFEWDNEQYFYRGRTVRIDFLKVEERIFDY